MTLSLRFAVKSDTGKKYDHNEDYYLLPEPSEKFGITAEAIEKKGPLFILTDGMGGANAGEVASQLAAGWAGAAFYGNDHGDTSLPKVLRGIIVDINRRIFDLAAEYEQYRGMCTTIVAAHMQEGRLTVCSVGDSRAYLFSRGRLDQITEDQSEVWEIYRAGGITRDEMRFHPRKHILKNVVGARRELTESDVNTYRKNLQPEDVVLLCSDGLSDMVADREIEAILAASGHDLEAAADQLVSEANRQGGRDNITAILFQAAI